MSKIVLPTNDLAFKKLFANEEHPEIIQGFLADVLGINVDIADIVFKNPYSIDSYQERYQSETEAFTETKFRETARDVTIAIIDTADVTIEMQLEKPDYFWKRTHYYADELYISNYNQSTQGKRSRYDSLKPVISLNIINFNIFQDNLPIHTFSYRENSTFKLLEPAYKTIGFWELPKSVDSHSKIDNWQRFLKTGQVPSTAPEYLHAAAKIIKYHNLTDQERVMIDHVQKAIDTSLAIELRRERKAFERGAATGLAEGRNEGLAEGMASGLAEGMASGLAEGARLREVEIARQALAQGLSPDMAARLTGLPLKEVQILAP